MPKPFVLSYIRNRAGAFVAEWRDAASFDASASAAARPPYTRSAVDLP